MSYLNVKYIVEMANQHKKAIIDADITIARIIEQGGKDTQSYKDMIQLSSELETLSNEFLAAEIAFV